MAYRIYLTDTIYYYQRKKSLEKRWYEIIKPVIGGRGSYDNRTGDEIAADVIARLGLKFSEDKEV